MVHLVISWPISGENLKMANKRVGELGDVSLPILGTDKILVSRDGINITKATIGDLPPSYVEFQWATRPDPMLHTGQLGFATDIGNSGTLFKSTGSRWRPTQPIILGRDYQKYSRINDSTSEILMSHFIIPENIIGENGRLIIEPVWTFTNNTSITKTVRVRVGYVDQPISNMSVIYNKSNSNMTLNCPYLDLCNRNSLTSQISAYSNGASFGGASQLAVVTTSLDTTLPLYVAFTVQYNATTPLETGSIEKVIIRVEG